MSETDTPPETPSSKANVVTPPQPKPHLARSEYWITVVTALASTAQTIFGSSDAATKIISGLVAIISVAIYAIYQSGLPSSKPGWKTPAFWTALVSIAGSMTLAISNAGFPFITPKEVKVLAFITSTIASAGYTIYRYNAKLPTTTTAT
jgi:drug/metabolite transporter (DMT)-like permease